MNEDDFCRMAATRTLYRLPGSRRRNPWPRRLAVIIAAVSIALILYACTGEAAGRDACAKERAAWRKAQSALVLGGQRPRSYETARVRLMQCEQGKRER